MNPRRIFSALIRLALLNCLLAACTPAPGAANPAVTATAPTPGPTFTFSPAAPLPTPTSEPPSIWLAPYLPQALRDALRLPPGWLQQENPESAGLRLTAEPEVPLSAWVYALAARFPTIADELSLADLRALWQDTKQPEGGPRSILVDPSTEAVFTLLWGAPSGAVLAQPAERLLELAWADETAWAIVPFEHLEPRWKVIAIDGQNPLHKDFDPQTYPLTVRFGLTGNGLDAQAAATVYGPSAPAPLLPESNRLTGKLTTVMLTGVTALVRATAAYMESFGMDYPATDLGPLLRDADILHISNEVAFAPNCPSPSNWDGLKFCSQARYIQLLDDIGTDVIDLAGDHFADWGPEAMLFSLDLYARRGWPVYGGGVNQAAAEQPARFEHNGNKIAFLGCNAKEIGYATAGPDSPGAVHCDSAWLLPAIRKVKEQGYLPIVTFQHQEYYEFIARPQLQADFRAAAGAGAVIVSGSQAHQPHTFEFTPGGSFLHYGLGNLFFDQVFSMDATDEAFLDRHVFYDGRYIGTELLTIQFVDYARARLMTPAERAALLAKVFAAGGWGAAAPGN